MGDSSLKELERPFALARTMIQGSTQEKRKVDLMKSEAQMGRQRFHARRPKRFAVGAVVVICAIICSAPAFAYRPFDGTDAAVADVGEVEIELQPVEAMRAGSTNKPISDGVLNFGFADRWELVLQGTAQSPLEGGGPFSVPDAAFLKYVVQPGVLQDKKGPTWQ